MPPIFNSLPFCVIGGVMAAYWYRVLRMARKHRRKTGKSGNLIPPEPLGRVLRIIWLPVIVVWIGHPIWLALRSHVPQWATPMWECNVIRYVGAAIVLTGFLLTRICWRRMGKSWRMGIDPAERTGLVFDGPFAYVRHPIYSLSCGMMAATMLALPSPLMLAVGAIHIGLLIWESSREERYLVLAHGSAYSLYQAQVGRILPRSLRPYRPTDRSMVISGQRTG